MLPEIKKTQVSGLINGFWECLFKVGLFYTEVNGGCPAFSI